MVQAPDKGVSPYVLSIVSNYNMAGLHVTVDSSTLSDVVLYN